MHYGRLIASALIGAIFALGLVISGMTLPAKVIGFLDLTGDWDPALGFIMVGAIGVHMSTRWLVLRRDGPVMGDAFPAGLPTQIDRRLLIGRGSLGWAGAWLATVRDQSSSASAGPSPGSLWAR